MRLRRLHAGLVLALALAGMAGCGAGHTSTRAAGSSPSAMVSRATATPTTFYQSGSGFADPATLGWLKASAQLPDDVAVAPSAPGTLYTCTGATAQSGQGSIALSVSTDGGATWQARDTGIPFARCSALAVSPVNAQYIALFVGSCRSDCGRDYTRLYLSLDAGAHWNQASPSTDSDSLVAFGGWAGSAFLANTVPDGTPAASTQFLAVSRDGVHFTWTTLPAASQQIFSFESTVVAVTGSSAPCALPLGGCVDLYRSVDLGASWTRATPTYQGNNVRPLALIPGGSTLLGFDARAFAGPNTYPLLRSADGGASWQPLPDAPANLQAATNSPSATPDGTIFVTFCCAASGASPAGGIYKLTPSAATWTLVSPVVPAQIRLSAVSWDAQGHPASLWGLGNVHPNTSSDVTDLWSHPA